MAMLDVLERARFNWLPACYADESWFMPWLTSPQIAALRSNPEALRTLNRYLLKESECLNEISDAVFESPLLWHILKADKQLLVWVRWLGLASQHEHIRKIICAKQQRCIKDYFGDAAYQFALERAAFLPAVFKQNAADIEKSQELIDTAMHVGMNLLAQAISAYPNDVKLRIRFFFPKKDEHYFCQKQDKNGNEKLIDNLIKIAQEINRKWSENTELSIS